MTYLDNKKENTIILVELAILLHRVKAALWLEAEWSLNVFDIK